MVTPQQRLELRGVAQTVVELRRKLAIQKLDLDMERICSGTGRCAPGQTLPTTFSSPQGSILGKSHSEAARKGIFNPSGGPKIAG